MGPLGLALFVKHILALCCSDIPNCVAVTKTGIPTDIGVGHAIFDPIPHSNTLYFFHKTVNSTLTNAGALIYLITTIFTYTIIFVWILGVCGCH